MELETKELSLYDLTKQVLSESTVPLTPRDIWEFAINRGYDKLLKSKGKTPWQTISSKLYIDTRDNPNSVFVRTGIAPVKFFLKDRLVELSLEEFYTKKIESQPEYLCKKLEFSEKDLHDILAYYSFYYLRVYVKTIIHNKSEKKGFMAWLHPDMVGCLFKFEQE